MRAGNDEGATVAAATPQETNQTTDAAIVVQADAERKPVELAALPELIDVAVAEAETHAGAAVAAAFRAGALLLQAKMQVSHGDWEPWLTAHCRVSVRTAQAYMRLHKRMGELPDENRNAVALLPLREAMTAISTPPTAPPSPGYRPSRTDADRISKQISSAGRTCLNLGREVRLNYRDIKQDRIKAARDKLAAAVAELDRMLSEVQA